jgi:hypothetical protein
MSIFLIAVSNPSVSPHGEEVKDAYVISKPMAMLPSKRKEVMQVLPMFADIYWIGGGTLGLILLIVLILALTRR